MGKIKSTLAFDIYYRITLIISGRKIVLKSHFSFSILNLEKYLSLYLGNNSLQNPCFLEKHRNSENTDNKGFCD